MKSIISTSFHEQKSVSMQEPNLPVSDTNRDERSIYCTEQPSMEAKSYQMSSYHVDGRTPVTLQGNFVADNSHQTLPPNNTFSDKILEGENNLLLSSHCTSQNAQPETMTGVINSQPIEHEVYAYEGNNDFAKPLHYVNIRNTSNQINMNLSNTDSTNYRYNHTRFNPLAYNLSPHAPLHQQTSDEPQITQQQLSHSQSNTYSENVTTRPLRRSNSKVSFILNDS